MDLIEEKRADAIVQLAYYQQKLKQGYYQRKKNEDYNKSMKMLMHGPRNIDFVNFVLYIDTY